MSPFSASYRLFARPFYWAISGVIGGVVGGAIMGAIATTIGLAYGLKMPAEAYPVSLDESAIKRAPVMPLTKAAVSASEFSIAGIGLDATEADILALLGSPKSREVAPTDYIDEVLYFGGVSVAIAGGQVWDIISTSPKFCTPSGVCPGDSVALLFDTLGPTELIPTEVGEQALYSGLGNCTLEFDIAAETIYQIKLACP
jgi:hypothetical protein